MPYDVFISYSTKDKTVADAVCAQLEADGVACWIAPRDIFPTETWPDAIVRALQTCRVMVLVFSHHANDSPQVRRELGIAAKNNLPILPFRIEATTPTGTFDYFLNDCQWLDALTPPLDKHIDRLSQTVRRLLNPPQNPAAPNEAVTPPPPRPSALPIPQAAETASPSPTRTPTPELSGAGTQEVTKPGWLSSITPVGVSVGTIAVVVTLATLTALRGCNEQTYKVPLASPSASVAVVPKPTPVSSPVARNVNPKDGAELVYIPAGPFLMGDNDMTKYGNPRRTVTLPAYSIYKNLVTVAMYEKFCKAMGKRMPSAPTFNAGWSKKDHPIVNVSWNDAKAYCNWAGAVLPSEAQWEKAARGTDGRLYPWGNEFDRSKLWCSKKALGDAGGTARVGSFASGASPYGVLDMAGNVWQWCDDWFNAHKKYKVVRGGACYYLTAVYFRCACRGACPPTVMDGISGFRCVLSSKLR